jgi:hypothetical protein
LGLQIQADGTFAGRRSPQSCGHVSHSDCSQSPSPQTGEGQSCGHVAVDSVDEQTPSPQVGAMPQSRVLGYPDSQSALTA